MKVLAERLRLGAETLKALGVAADDELVVAALNTLTNDDELVEVTPKNIRMRKRVLDRVERGRMRGRAKNAAVEK